MWALLTLTLSGTNTSPSWGCPGPCGELSSIAGLHPLGFPSNQDNQKCPQTFLSLGDKIIRC